jgi:acyl carrier protein
MSTLQELQALIQEKFDIDASTIDPNESLREKGLDSLTIVEFVFDVEDRYKISLPDQSADIETLQGLANAVDAAVAAKAAADAKSA